VGCGGFSARLFSSSNDVRDDGLVDDKPWWLRFDGAPRWLERSRDRRATPLRAAEVWILRAVALGALGVIIWSLVTGHVNLAVALMVSLVASAMVAAAGMTRSQRGQVLGRNVPEQHR
jgi:hypothetical protein